MAERVINGLYFFFRIYIQSKNLMQFYDKNWIIFIHFWIETELKGNIFVTYFFLHSLFSQTQRILDKNKHKFFQKQFFSTKVNKNSVL